MGHPLSPPAKKSKLFRVQPPPVGGVYGSRYLIFTDDVDGVDTLLYCVPQTVRVEEKHRPMPPCWYLGGIRRKSWWTGVQMSARKIKMSIIVFRTLLPLPCSLTLQHPIPSSYIPLLSLLPFLSILPLLSLLPFLSSSPLSLLPLFVSSSSSPPPFAVQ